MTRYTHGDCDTALVNGKPEEACSECAGEIGSIVGKDRCIKCGDLIENEARIICDECREEHARKTDEELDRDAAFEFLDRVALQPTPDAVDQLMYVFLPALRIMCERGYDPHGQTWQRAGRMGTLADIRKKFERLWERAWVNGREHDDSAIDLINYAGFYLRASQSGWGDWGSPGGDVR